MNKPLRCFAVVLGLAALAGAYVWCVRKDKENSRAKTNPALARVLKEFADRDKHLANAGDWLADCEKQLRDDPGSDDLQRKVA